MKRRGFLAILGAVPFLRGVTVPVGLSAVLPTPTIAPLSPAARLDRIARLVEGGFLSKADALEMLDDPKLRPNWVPHDGPEAWNHPPGARLRVMSTGRDGRVSLKVAQVSIDGKRWEKT